MSEPLAASAVSAAGEGTKATSGRFATGDRCFDRRVDVAPLARVVDGDAGFGGERERTRPRSPAARQLVHSDHTVSEPPMCDKEAVLVDALAGRLGPTTVAPTTNMPVAAATESSEVDLRVIVLLPLLIVGFIAVSLSFLLLCRIGGLTGVCRFK